VQQTPARLVERFYYDLWNTANETLAWEILHPDFQFRASLGPEKIGPGGFIEYMRLIHTALSGYRCTIQELLESGERVAARLSFGGVHRAMFFGIPRTGREIVWSGAAFFHIIRFQIVSLWVLGDVDAVKRQLGAAPSSSGP
jgi:predicted ester cyclase